MNSSLEATPRPAKTWALGRKAKAEDEDEPFRKRWTAVSCHEVSALNLGWVDAERNCGESLISTSLHLGLPN